MKNSGKDYWKNLECIQTGTTDLQKFNQDKFIIVNFFANIKDKMSECIDYDYKSIGEDEDLIKNDEKKYCLKQVYKICFYVSKIYQYEILKMKCEFVKDLHGTIWFYHASHILAR